MPGVVWEKGVEMSSGLQFTGWFGELKTVIAKKLFLRSSDYVDINDVTIRTRRGTTQIDHVIISRYGVFVVETKNMSGWVFGSENDPFWIKTNRGNKLKFQNPLHQNESHIRALSKLGQNPAREDAFRRRISGQLQSEDRNASKRLNWRLHYLRQEQEAGALHRG